VGAGHALEGTLTFGYTPVKNLEVRAEVRYDKLSAGFVNALPEDAYVRANPGEEDQIDANNNSEFALQAVYKFSLP
jgi:hypothetical protein